MGNHINFVENVYENVKHPLGYINNKIKNFMGNEETYSLTDNNNNSNNNKKFSNKFIYEY